VPKKLGNCSSDQRIKHSQKVTVLGPSLFICYINDIAYGFDATVRLFADDTIDTNTDSAYLQRDLDRLAQWENKWENAFHLDKYQVVSISREKTTIQFDYRLHSQSLQDI